MLKHKLGALPKKHDPRNLKFSKYAKDIPPIPPSCDYSHYVTDNWPMDKNDMVGDCTCAAIAKKIQLDSTIQGSPVVPTDDEVLSVYEAVTGIEGAAYDPITGANDNGCAVLDVLKYWQQSGMTGHKIGAFVETNVNNINDVKASIYLFGGVDIGFNVPGFLENLEKPGSVWDWNRNTSNSESVGGHSVWVIDFTPAYLTIISWGALYYMTYNFWKRFVTEAYPVMSDEWLNGEGQAPNGFDFEQLSNDLDKVKA